MPTETLPVNIYGLPGTSEYQAAEWLRNIIRCAMLPADSGTVSIHTDVYLTGQKREQIDILLHAYFPTGLSRKVRLSRSEMVDISFLDIIAVIEVKAHGRDKVDLAGTNAHVLYRDRWESASSQSNDQIYSVKQFIRRELEWTPYVCNLIFFPSLVKSDFPPIPHHYLAANSTFQDLLEQLCISKRLSAPTLQSSTVTFRCTPVHTPTSIEEQHTQLLHLLGNSRRDVACQPPVQAKPRTSQLQYRSTVPQFPRHGYRRQLSRRLIRISIAGIFCLFVLGSIFARLRGFPSAATPFTAKPFTHGRIATCDAITPSCGCQERGSFHEGATVYAQLIGSNRTPVSAEVRDPLGKSSPLPFRNLNLNPKYFKGHCFVARYPINRGAAPGAYALQVTTRSADGQEGVLSRAFNVTHRH